MAIKDLIRPSEVRARLGEYPHPIDSIEDTPEGKRVTIYTGCVLDKFERNFYDDSDFYAIVFDKTLGICKTMLVGTTRAAFNIPCQIDATDEIEDRARQWLYDWHIQFGVAASERAVRKIEVGKCVQFMKAYRPRKETNIPVEVGQLAYVRKLYPDYFKRNEFKALVQFTNGPLIGETAFHSLDKLAVFSPEVYEQSMDTIRANARRHADSEQWRAPFSPLVYQF